MAHILVEAFDGLINGRIVSVPAGTELSAANDGDAIIAAGAATFEFSEGNRDAVAALVEKWRGISATRTGVKLISFVSQVVTAPIAQVAYSGAGDIAAPAFAVVVGNAPTGTDFAWTRNGRVSNAGLSAAGDIMRVTGRFTLVTDIGVTPQADLPMPAPMLSSETTHGIVVTAFTGDTAQVITAERVTDEDVVRFLGTGVTGAEATIVVDFAITYQAAGAAA